MKPISEIVESATTEIIRPTVRKKCTSCPNEFDAQSGPLEKYIKECPACAEARMKEDNKRIVVEAQIKTRPHLIESWKRFCPIEYQSLNAARLPNPNKLAEVLAWQYSGKGLLLHGESFRGKSRCAWALLEREYVNGRTVQYLDSMAGIQYASRFSESAAIVEQWMTKLIATDILLLDDVFKVKLTDSFESVIFTLIDQRIQKQKPSIVTSNDTGDTLQSRMSQDRATPLLNRLRSHCTQINFNT